jgi:hypothetical protein
MLPQALAQAAAGRAHILQEMQACSPPPARALSRWAPKVAMLSVPAEKLGMLIGPVSAPLIICCCVCHHFDESCVFRCSVCQQKS